MLWQIGAYHSHGALDGTAIQWMQKLYSIGICSVISSAAVFGEQLNFNCKRVSFLLLYMFFSVPITVKLQGT